MRDALYQKIDNVLDFTFNQEVKLTKGSILQQFNDAGVTQAYGTIVNVPAGTLENPGVGTTYEVGKIYGTSIILIDSAQLLEMSMKLLVNTSIAKNQSHLGKQQQHTLHKTEFTIRSVFTKHRGQAPLAQSPQPTMLVL